MMKPKPCVPFVVKQCRYTCGLRPGLTQSTLDGMMKVSLNFWPNTLPLLVKGVEELPWMAPNTQLPKPIWRIPFTIGGLIVMSVKRLIYRPGLTLLALLGIVLAVGLVSSATFFSQAVDQVVLNQELDHLAETTGRPPFSSSIYLFPSNEFPVTLQNAEQLADHLANTLASEVGLPLKHRGVQLESGGMMMFTKAGTDGKEPTYLDTVTFVYVEGVGSHLKVTGAPLDEGAPEKGVLDVWMHSTLAEKIGANVGDEYNVALTMSAQPVIVRIRGLWQAIDPKETFWFRDPDSTLASALLVRRGDYIQSVQPMVASGSRYAGWHVMLDNSKVIPDKARSYVTGFERAMVVIHQYLPGAKLDAAPVKSLENFVLRNRALATLLLGFDVPTFGFLLYFLVLTSAIIARWQRRETAILVSRGMSLGAVLEATTVEEIILFILGLPLGLAFGMVIAQLIGRTSSFLMFVPKPDLPVTLRGINWPVIAAMLGVSLLARLWPAMGAARTSTVDQEREQARVVRNPFWQRYFLDVLLVFPTAYAYKQLADRGSLAMLVTDNPTDLYRDPLLILVPALFVLTAGLLIMRLFPLIIGIMDRIASLVPWTTPYIALRQLGRQSQSYINPLLLIIVSLALGVYTFSMAASLDQWLVDRMYYKVGADISFKPAAPETSSGGGTSTSGSSSGGSGEQWVLPIEEFTKLPGVAGGTRVGDYKAGAELQGGKNFNGRFLGIDRLVFPSVAWFRDDFADEPLGGLMNHLAEVPDGILVQEDVLQAGNLTVGQQIPLHVSLADDMGVDSTFTIVGTFKHFPTIYADQPAVVGNLEYLFSFFGMAAPHNIWLKLEPGVQGKDIVKEIQGLGIEPSQMGDARGMIATEMAKTERSGVFGTLSVGFLAASFMAIIGLLINTYASLNDRVYHFTIMHAIGLQRRQLLGQICIEYVFLTVYGAGAGALVGATASQLFSPFFRVTGTQELVLPALVPVVDMLQIRNMAVIFAAILLFLELVVIAAALQKRLFRMMALRTVGGG
jgi:putative ABC transport system permease protein